MITQIKKYSAILIIVIIVGRVVYYFNAYSLVKTKSIKQKTDSILIQSKTISLQDSLLWCLQQDIDIAKKNEVKLQIVIAEQKNLVSKALAAEKQATEAIEHYEQNGLIRYFEKPFWSKCYIEVFQKPECVKIQKK